jgi:hypothetical protein
MTLKRHLNFKSRIKGDSKAHTEGVQLSDLVVFFCRRRKSAIASLAMFSSVQGTLTTEEW